MTQDTPAFTPFGFLARRHGRRPKHVANVASNMLVILAGALGLMWGPGVMAEPLSNASANPQAKPLPTHVCSPRMGDYNDRQAFIGFDDGSVQWCLSRNQCNRLSGLPETPSKIVAFSCEREQFVWVIRADGQVYRCAGAVGRKSCDKVPIQ